MFSFFCLLHSMPKMLIEFWSFVTALWCIFTQYMLMMKKVFVDDFQAFYRFQQCKRMRNHLFAGQNTQHLKLVLTSLGHW